LIQFWHYIATTLATTEEKYIGAKFSLTLSNVTEHIIY